MIPTEISQNWEALVALGAEYGLDLLAGVVILIVGWWIAGWTKRLVLRGLNRVPAVDETLKPFLHQSRAMQ